MADAVMAEAVAEDVSTAPADGDDEDDDVAEDDVDAAAAVGAGERCVEGDSRKPSLTLALLVSVLVGDPVSVGVPDGVYVGDGVPLGVYVPEPV